MRLTKNKRVLAATAVAAVAMAAAGWYLGHLTTWGRPLPMVQTDVGYVLMAGGKPMMRFDHATDSGLMMGGTLCGDSIGHGQRADTMPSPQAMLKATKAWLEQQMEMAADHAAETDYYMQVHSVKDEGYDMVASHALAAETLADSQGRMLSAIDSMASATTPTIMRTATLTRLDSVKPSGLMVSQAGGVWHRGWWLKRTKHGTGIGSDSLGRPLQGWWHSDTLAMAMRTDSLGTYQGAVNRHGMAHGHGAYTFTDGTYMEGHWKDDSLDGFAFLLSREHLRAGIWRNGRFRGERMRHTPERIYGIDISRYQHGHGNAYHPIHWAKLRITHLGRHNSDSEGPVDYPVAFVYIKSTEGTSIQNPHYKQDYAQANRHGLLCGAYHFFSTRTPAAEQAQYFIKNTMLKKGDLPPVLDVEPTDAQIAAMGGADKLMADIRTWMRIVEEHIGCKPILYVNQRFVNKYLQQAPDIKTHYKVWIARYGQYRPDVKLLIWQLCHDGRVTGIVGDVDINVFNGYEPQFRKFTETELIGS